MQTTHFTPEQQTTPSTNTASPQPSPCGRPTLLTPALLRLICELIAAYGCSDTAAAKRAGVAPSTLSRWKQDHPELGLDFAAAREDFRFAQLDEIKNARTRDGRPDWRAAAWLLERIFPEDYSRSRKPASTIPETPSAFPSSPPPSPQTSPSSSSSSSPTPPANSKISETPSAPPPPPSPAPHTSPSPASSPSTPPASSKIPETLPQAPIRTPSAEPRAIFPNPFQNSRKPHPLTGSIQSLAK